MTIKMVGKPHMFIEKPDIDINGSEIKIYLRNNQIINALV